LNQEYRIKKLTFGKPLLFLNSSEQSAKYAVSPTNSEIVYDEDQQVLIFPVLFLYPEVEQSDFIEKFAGNDTFEEHLQQMFPAASQSNNEQDFFLSKGFVAPNIEIYFQTYATEIINVHGQETQEQRESKAKKWIRVKQQAKLLDALQYDGHVIPKFPVFYLFVKNSSFNSTFLKNT